MARFSSLALTAAAIVGLTTLGVPAASANLADITAEARRATAQGLIVIPERLRKPQLRPRPTATPTPTPVPSSPAPPTTACAFPTVSFDGAAYCPATIDGVRGTSHGTGTRVVVRGVTVSAVTPSTVTVAVWTFPPCPPGKFCGQLMTLQSLTVAWSGSSRPAYGDVLDLFGQTVPTSITPVGYVTTGWCPIDWC
jgi:hypothetical protein